VICVNPSGGAFDAWTIVPLVGALFAAGVTTSVKRLTRTESPLTIMLWTYLVMGLMAAVPAWLTWRAPTSDEIGLVLAMGLCSAIGQGCTVYALRAGEATAVTPFEYGRLLYAALFGFLFFGEIPAAGTWLGAAVIIASTLYIGLREARRGRA
jgi:drug/metabolite transporter (DMT)-like permease